MDNAITAIKENWLELVNRLKDLPQPFQQEVFLLNCHIAGTSHAEAAKANADSIKPGLQLTLRREPANECDGQAISVLLQPGERIGYIPQKHNPVISAVIGGFMLLIMILNIVLWVRINRLKHAPARRAKRIQTKK